MWVLKIIYYGGGHKETGKFLAHLRSHLNVTSIVENYCAEC